MTGRFGPCAGPLSELLAEAAVFAEMAADEGHLSLREVLADAAALLQARVAVESSAERSFSPGSATSHGPLGLGEDDLAFPPTTTPGRAGLAPPGAEAFIPSPAVIGVQKMAGKGFLYVVESADDQQEDDDGDSDSD